MNYKEFCKTVEARIKEFLPDRYENAEVHIVKIMKNNDVERVGISIRESTEMLAPTIYLESFYDCYKKNESMEQTMVVLANAIKEAKTVEAPTIPFDIKQLDTLRDRIHCKLVNAKDNAKVLSELPFASIENLAVIYMIDIGYVDCGYATIKITNEMRDMWGIDTQELHQIAIENAPRLSPPVLTEMRDTLGFLLGDEEPDNVTNLLDGGQARGEDLYVLTNTGKHFGAATILYPGLLESISEVLGGKDYYILPSSVHECLVVPKDADIDPTMLGDMVRGVNETQVDAEDRLADCVFVFERGVKGFAIVPESVAQNEMERV